MHKVFIDGSSGTTGLRLRERMLGRSDVQLIEIEDSLRKNPDAIRACMEQAHVSFLCLPDAAAREAAVLAKGTGCRIIDTSTAHRTADGWAYGFAELSEKHRNSIKNADFVASPGCHASGFISLVYPLVEAGLLPPDYPLCCTSVTGYSGGGKSMIADYESPRENKLLSSPRQYGLGQCHKHLPEMVKVCGLTADPVFMPIVADFYAGMLVTVPLHSRCLPCKPTLTEIHDVLARHYAGSRLVKVMEPSNEGMLSANALAGKDDLHIHISGNDDRILLHALFDNLGKGASGAAIQCFNIMIGADECAGLEV